MSISRKRDFLREIGMMVRRESIIFDPDDRVVTQLPGAGSVCYVGGVRYDYETGRLVCSLFDSKGEEYVSRSGVTYLDDSLDSVALRSVSSAVARYAEASMYRARSMGVISSVVEERGSLDFGSDVSSAPVLQVDVHRDGNLTPGRLVGMFCPLEGSDVYLNIALMDRDKPFSYPLSRLSDMGVSSVHRFVIGRLGLDKTQQENVGVRQEPVQKTNEQQTERQKGLRMV